MAAKATNPLLSPQREKAGSETAADYAYQYHWALYRAIKEQELQKEYAIFVELHEDVVFCNSLDHTKAKFHFNQVKTTGRTFTKTALLTKKNGKSVLGKLISSNQGKPFSASVTELNLVATSGFGLKLKDPKLSLSTIKLQDIDDTELAAIALAIKNELSVDPLPTTLQFIIPELPDKHFQQFMIGEIAKLIAKLYPASNCNAVDIYRILLDELNRKGEVTYDFSQWNDVLKNKAVTSITVTTVINQYTNIKDEARVMAEFNAIVSEIKLSVMESKALRQSFERYRQHRLGNKTVSQLDINNQINALIISNISAANNNIKSLIELVLSGLDTNLKSNFTSDNDVKAAIICEYIMRES